MAKTTPQKSPTVGFVSLGCAKALVDSERILTQLRAEGYGFSATHEGADVVIVNTCGFLDSARDESLSAIGDAMSENGKVIVTGCLGARPEVIRDKFPNVLSISGPQQYESVIEAVHEALPPVHNPHVDLLPAGVKLTPRHYAYVKISEGCNNRCSFCIIPSLRGDLVSRSAADVMGEAEKLVASGVKELLIISQDTSAYGVDVKYAESEWKGAPLRAKFIDLARALGTLGVWVRLHYVYPYPHVDQVIGLMGEGKILPYLDIPFQHASPKILKAMKRPAADGKTLERIRKWREACPDLAIRSTFITGFPGETEEDFEYLLNWLKEAQLDRVGCFTYENVDGAAAKALGDHVPEEVKHERKARLMQVQAEISAARLRRRIGKTLPVIIDSIGSEGVIGRTQGDAPEVDGIVRVNAGKKRPLPGHIVQVKIESADEHDLAGTLVA